MKTKKTMVQLSDIEIAANYLRCAEARLLEVGEPNLLNRIRALAGDVEWVRETAIMKEVGNA